MFSIFHDPQIEKILSPPDTPMDWERDLQKLINGDQSLNRHSAGENSIKALQRLMIFLGYSTSAKGSFSIDGGFGRGTNRGLAQFQFEHGLAASTISRKELTYPCQWNNSANLIKAIPDVSLNLQTLEKMAKVAKENIQQNKVNCGSFEEAIFQLNALQNRKMLNCKEINIKYGSLVENAVQEIKTNQGIIIQTEWILAIIRQETAGVIRPKFEQHIFSKRANQNPEKSLEEIRFEAMSFGLGQIMGFNYKNAGAQSAEALYTAPLPEQIKSIGMFMSKLSRSARNALTKKNPTLTDFQAIARAYNGTAYAKNHYDEHLQTWFREFTKIRS
ncbi:MAG: N-acetylmuramidase domain-containing protein [Bacteroidia bacterium]|nr:N-acetylmuramidase domain-containing protein [Bacteroidia bacterium]